MRKDTRELALSLFPCAAMTEGHWAHSERQLSASQEQSLHPNLNMRIIFCCLSHTVYSILFWQHEQIKTSELCSSLLGILVALGTEGIPLFLQCLGTLHSSRRQTLSLARSSSRIWVVGGRALHSRSCGEVGGVSFNLLRDMIPLYSQLSSFVLRCSTW